MEWQYAAQGGDSARLYPWGGADDVSCRPSVAGGRTTPAPADSHAHAHARCASPLGLLDLVGNVWQFTADEFQDEHTRFAVLRGGSHYDIRDHAVGARHIWYAPVTESLRLDRYVRYALMDDAFERAYTIGFRCVYNASAPT